MSRVIVKNVPPKATEKTLSELFSQCGEVTDAKLIRTQTGFSRRFGFVGFVSDAQAKTAVEKFDRSFIETSRISVEVAKPYGDESLERPWSKYSKGSSAYSQRERAKMEREKKRLGKERKVKELPKEESGVSETPCKEKIIKSKMSSMLSDFHGIEEEEEFQEFLSMHTHKTQVKTWGDGLKKTDNKKKVKLKCEKSVKHEQKQVEGVAGDGLRENVRKKRARSRSKLELRRKRVQTHQTSAGESSGGEIEDELTEEENEGEREESMEVENTSSSGGAKKKEREAVTAKSCITDMDYLRSKVVSTLTSEATVEEVANTEEEEMGELDEEQDQESGESSDNEDEEIPTNQGGNEFSLTMYTLRMRGLPFRATKEDVETFFYPLTLVDVRFTSDKDGRPSGRAYVDFNSEQDMDQALKQNGDCIGKRYIELFHDEGPQSAREEKYGVEPDSLQQWEMLHINRGEEDETIADSGRLFLRNLSYTVNEENLTETFEKFGPLTEVTIPLDKNTNRPTGLGFVMFMLPEHAVKAYEALDGQVFQGRLLHILPARPRQSRAVHSEEGNNSMPGGTSSFKKKRESQQKSQAGSSHNWNTLFLGANAVVDAMAQRYSTQKSSILDSESSHSVAVRMALGETQLVSETREFLESHGVRLNVFEQKKPKRSSTVILVKNLPHGTKQSELQELFSPFGSLDRVILPPSGVSSLVEFLEPSHAKSAFKKLAYTKFKHLPLYLEWAPLGAVERREETAEKVAKDSEMEDSVDAKKEVKDEEERETGEQCTLFVKNLNFSTNEDQLTKVFSRIGAVKKAEVARKRNMKDPTHPLSMGFGFVEFSTPQLAQEALKDLQHTELEGHKLELKLSHRVMQTVAHHGRKVAKKADQKSSKIMVRNIPFEASTKEVRELFQTFGQLKTVRLPKKLATVGEHRGFGFVEFMTKEDARRAFESLCQSTHLYGRRLVLEWAEGEESVEQIRKRTAEHFHGLQAASSVSLKRRKAELLLYGNSKHMKDD